MVADPRHFTRNQVRAPAHSVVLIMAATYEAFLPAAGQVLAVVSMPAVSTVVGAFMAAVGAAKDTRV
jgi:hypothetical protein